MQHSRMTPFIAELEAFKSDRLAPIIQAGRISIDNHAANPTALLGVALANEISVSDLAAAWIPTTREIDVKIALARQAGDEANHFNLVGHRLASLGVDLTAWAQPPDSPLFTYMKQLGTTVERVAAGLFTLESLAYDVNENFIALCERRGDHETVRIYREYIQPDERAHQKLGQYLLAKYATTDELRALARETVGRVLEIATATRARAAEHFGTACFPGC